MKKYLLKTLRVRNSRGCGMKRPIVPRLTEDLTFIAFIWTANPFMSKKELEKIVVDIKAEEKKQRERENTAKLEKSKH